MLFLSPKGKTSESRRSSMDSKHRKHELTKRGGPKLERRNAVKNIDYDAEGTASVSRGATWSAPSHYGSEHSHKPLGTRSLDVSPSDYSNRTSFRIDGSIDGEVELLYQSLGLNGPEDFGISINDWEQSRVRSSSDVPSTSRLQFEILETSEPAVKSEGVRDSRVDNGEKAQQILSSPIVVTQLVDQEIAENQSKSRSSGDGNGGIRGVRPPILAPPVISTFYSPPVSSHPPVEDKPIVLKPPPGSMLRPAEHKTTSSWDIINSFGPEHANTLFGMEKKLVDSEEDEEEVEEEEEEEEEEEIGLPEESIRDELRELKWEDTPEGFTGVSSYSTMNDDETSSTTTETMVSPNGRLKIRIKSWGQGVLLGSGSYGRVFEAMSEEGVFFAVKEVSLLDQGSNAQQCISQLEQEIALLSQFEHENIVQYYGTEKEEGKLFIFLELVSQGSLVSLYRNYTLRDSQVSAYTRQILSGLNYLHERNVVHRDIKCANILVHANGSVKLADFGLAKEISKINMLKSCKGSVYWMAPEVINPRKTYGPSADIWSLGCTILEMLTRDIPFPNLEWTVAFFKIGQGQQPPIPDSISEDARDFISQCVRVNPDERPTASALLEHPFIKRSPSSRSEYSSPNNHRLR